MKTDNKTQSNRPKSGAPGGHRNNSYKGGQGKRKNSFFRDVPKSENKAFRPHRKDGGGGGGKRALGVQKTVGFKAKQGPKRPGHDGRKSGPGGGHKHQRSNNAKKGPHGQKNTTASPAPEPIRFDSKPEKVNYCLAPDRLVAQARAIKHFERQEREQEIERKKVDRQQKHKMMTQKTRKGQPVMQGRLELLYEKVKKVVGVQ
uniref:rRNA-processing protein FYV7 n=1 Tax=Anopheles farauti TaxID=69004 RepID=A0A182R121_9DIPT